MKTEVVINNPFLPILTVKKDIKRTEIAENTNIKKLVEIATLSLSQDKLKR